ncbi:hypothetical protein ACVI1J_001763 [Bradyrhizobium diazoefficiens]
MGSDFDPQKQAEAAMKAAVNADGFERQRWIRFAQAWLELARSHHGSALRSRPARARTHLWTPREMQAIFLKEIGT